MTIMEEQRQQQPVQTPQANGEQPKPRSGYARLRNRHRALIADKEELQRDYFALLDQQAALQRDVDNLLAQHDRLMKAARLRRKQPVAGAPGTVEDGRPGGAW